ncbi:MAG: DUF6293 family protein [Halobacteriota archaeon]
MRSIHVATICPNKDVILDSLKKSGYPVQKVYLVSCDQKSQKNRFEDIENALRAVAETEIIDVSHMEVDNMVEELLKTVDEELENGNRVFLNSTDAPEVLHLALYTTARITGCKLYAGVSKGGGRVDEVMEIPLIPYNSIERDKLRIIKIIHQEGDELESLDKLIHLFEVESGEIAESNAVSSSE